MKPLIFLFSKPASLDFIQTEEGRAVPAENSTYAYEYFIKDHLGNVRASLKTEPEVIEFLATMEQDSVDEELYFKNLESRQNDAAQARNGSYSAYLNNASEFAKNRGIGPAIMLRVSPGDTVNASVYGKYADKTDNTEHVVDNIFTLLATAFGLNAATSEAGLAANGMENALAGQAAITPDGTAPKAYLNYIFLDKNFDPDSDHDMGFERLPSGALNNYQLLEKEISIDKEGFLYIFVANESPYDQDVWFDDFKVEVTKNKVTAVSDYYPFGMLQAGNSTNSSDPLGNKYLYNGKELQEETGNYDYGWRRYDPTIARWNGVDNLAEKYYSFSPYHYAGNNPIKNIDIDGNEFTDEAWKYVNKLISEINSRQDRNNEKIESKQAQLAEGGLSARQEKRLNRQIGRLESANQELEGVRGEIATLEASDQVYNVVESSSQNEGGHLHGGGTEVAFTSFNFGTGNVDITVSPGAGLGLFSHELLHAYQFETGQASLGDPSSSGGYSFILDKHDELAGYQRQGLFGSNQGVTSISTLPTRYESLPTGPVSIHNFNPAVSTAIQLNNTTQLQQLANQRNQAFRVNGTTYIPNR